MSSVSYVHIECTAICAMCIVRRLQKNNDAKIEKKIESYQVEFGSQFSSHDWSRIYGIKSSIFQLHRVFQFSFWNWHTYNWVELETHVRKNRTLSVSALFLYLNIFIVDFLTTYKTFSRRSMCWLCCACLQCYHQPRCIRRNFHACGLGNWKTEKK